MTPIECSVVVVMKPESDSYAAIDEGAAQFSWKTALGLAREPSFAVKM